MKTIVFTSSSILDLLTQIDELNKYEISVHETETDIYIEIGNSSYRISGSFATDINTKKDTISDIEEINTENYELLSEQDDFLESIDSGVIKQIAKTLLIGGLVRLTNRLIKK